MAIISINVPDEVKFAFDKEFTQENQNAIVANLMKLAIEENRTKKRRSTAINEILFRREQ